MISKNGRGYGPGKYAIELQHTMAGWVKDIDGGHATAEVVTEKMGSDHLARKHLGPLKYEEISFKCGTGMSTELYKWIETGFNQSFNTRGREDGAIIHADYDSNELSRLTWHQGIITEFGMPALDASSKDAALMSLKFKPEITRKELGKSGSVKLPTDASKQKKWLPSNFRLVINGCEEGCKWVNKIEALTIKQKVAENGVGEKRDYEQIATAVEVPNLVITLSEHMGDNFYRWHEDFVVKGNCGQDAEKSATLEYLTPNLQEVLFTLTFQNLGIFKISPDKVEAGGETVRRLKAEMYCEDIKFNFSSAATFGGR